LKDLADFRIRKYVILHLLANWNIKGSFDFSCICIKAI